MNIFVSKLVIFFFFLQQKWNPTKNILILGELISRVEEMGREDVVKVLRAGCSIYRIITLEESMSLPVVESDDSLLIQQKQQQQELQQQQNGSSD